MPLSIGRGLSAARCRQVLQLTALILVTASLANAQLFYPVDGSIKSVRAVQLWYNGYWKHPGWLNGTMVPHSASQRSGRIVCLFGKDILAPYEKWVDKYTKEGARALVVIRQRSGTPGRSMYWITGQDQSKLTIPVVELHQFDSDPFPLAKLLPEAGMEISLWPEENPWKKANENAFQAVFSVFHSLMELAILSFAVIRLHQWATIPGYSLRAIGPVCIMLEMVSCMIRLAFTVVDPFWTYRTLPDTPAQVLMTASLPFLFSGGILLTFFWAEALTTSRIHVTPFISEYKKSAFTVIALLFVVEISTTVARFLVPAAAFDPVYVTQVFYVLVAITLTVCYIICAVKISHRLQLINKKKSHVRNMMLRFALSTGGYIIFIIFTILSIFLLKYPWGWKIVMNGMFFSANISGVLQMYSFKPPIQSKSTTSSSGIGVSFHEGTKTNSAGESRRKRTDYSRNSVSSPRHHSSTTTSSSSSTDSSSKEESVPTTTSHPSLVEHNCDSALASPEMSENSSTRAAESPVEVVIPMELPETEGSADVIESQQVDLEKQV